MAFTALALVAALTGSSCATAPVHTASDEPHLTMRAKPRQETRTEGSPSDYMYSIITELYDPVTGGLEQRVLDQPNRTLRNKVTVTYDEQGRQAAWQLESDGQTTRINYTRNEQGQITRQVRTTRYQEGEDSIEIRLFNPNNLPEGTEGPMSSNYGIRLSDYPTAKRLGGTLDAQGRITDGIIQTFNKEGNIVHEDYIREGVLVSSREGSFDNDPTVEYNQDIILRLHPETSSPDGR